MKRLFRRQIMILALSIVSSMAAQSFGQVSVDPSNRYYRNAAGQPVFLLGYYDWAAVPDGFFIDQPSRYLNMINQDAPYKINYIRISLGVNRHTSSTNPPSFNGQPTPVPFLYNGSGKADLNQWDSTFWTGLRNQCSLAQSNGIIVHVSFFDGVELRSQGGAAYGYSNSFWKPSNQSATFYSNPDTNGNGQIDDSGEFYQTTNFNNDTGIGHYQRLLISKAITETAAYNNVFYEVANELLASDATWYTAVIAYAKTLTSRPVTQENNFVCGSTGCGRTNNLNGWSEHVADTPAQVKSNVAAIVGAGVPAWEDPDGPALSDDNVSPDDLRRAAWYSFTGGAAGWGGFTVDFWAGGTFNSTKTTYYKNLISFIQDSGVHFENMVPLHSVVSNGGTTNSCLARVGVEAVVYVLSDASVNVDLTGVSGTVKYRLYDPRANIWSGQLTTTGGGVRTFNKPAGTTDWVIYLGNGGPPVSNFTNSSFENGFTAAGGGYNGSVGTGWTPYTYTGVPSDLTFSDETGAGNFDSGAHSQKIQAGAGKEGGIYNRFSVVNGQTYTVTVRCKSGSPAAWCFFGINTSGGTDAHEASGTIYPADNARSTSWQTFSWTGTATGNFITLFLDTYDGVGYWDTATPASPGGGGPVTISNSAFASSADGWNIVVWHTGPNLDGTMAFEGGTGNPAGDMLSGASGGTNNTDSCTREGGEINKTISTAGYNTLVQVQYDLRFNTDQSGPSCIGNCTTLEGTCADKIAVYYSTAGTGGPWTLLEAVNALSLTQNVWSTRTINCPAAANNKANFALRFRFQFNTAPIDNGRLDNIKVIGTP